MVSRLILISLCALVLLTGCGDEPAAKKKNKKARGKNDIAANEVFGGKLVKALVGQLKSSDAEERAEACRALGNQYGGAKGALPALEKVKAKDKSREVRRAAAEAIKKIKSQG